MPDPTRPLTAAAVTAPAPRRRLGWLGAAAGVLLGLLALLIGCELAGWPFLRGPLQSQLAKRLGATVRIDAPFALRLLRNPGVDAAGLHIGSPAEFGVPHLVEAAGLSAGWRWRDVFAHDEGEPWLLDTLKARTLDAHLVRQADGRTNWGSPPTPAVPPEGAQRLALPVQVRLFALQDGRLRLRDAPLQAEMDSRFSWQEGAADEPARFRAQAEGRWRSQPFALKAEALGLLPLVAAGSDVRNLVPLEVQGRIGATEMRFRGVAAELLDARALSGSLLVRGPSLASLGQALGITLPTTPPFRLAGALRHDDGLWGLVATEGHIGGSRLVADLQFDNRGARPLLSGSLGGSLLRLKDLGPAVGANTPGDAGARAPVLDGDGPPPVAAAAATAASASGAKRAGRVLPDRSFDLPSLRAMDAEVRVAIARLDLGNDAAIQPLQQLRTELSLKQGVLTLDKLHAQVAGGTVQGLTRLDAADPRRAASWHADLRFGDLRLEQWLPVLKQSAPGTGKRRNAEGGAPVPLATGILDARVDVRGAGRSTAAILASLDGRASARVRQGTVSHLLVELAGLDVAESLGVWVRGDKPLTLVCARMASQITNGVLVLRQGMLDTTDSTLRVAGQIDLRDESMALRAQVKPKDFSLLSLRSPIVVGGTLSDPEMGIEGRRLAPRLLAAVALAVAAPLAGLLPLLELGGTDDAQPGCGS